MHADNPEYQEIEEDVGDFLPGSPMMPTAQYVKAGRFPPKRRCIALGDGSLSPQNSPNGYSIVPDVPAGARHIRVNVKEMNEALECAVVANSARARHSSPRDSSRSDTSVDLDSEEGPLWGKRPRGRPQKQAEKQPAAVNGRATSAAAQPSRAGEPYAPWGSPLHAPAMQLGLASVGGRHQPSLPDNTSPRRPCRNQSPKSEVVLAPAHYYSPAISLSPIIPPLPHAAAQKRPLGRSQPILPRPAVCAPRSKRVASVAPGPLPKLFLPGSDASKVRSASQPEHQHKPQQQEPRALVGRKRSVAKEEDWLFGYHMPLASFLGDPWPAKNPDAEPANAAAKGAAPNGGRRAAAMDAEPTSPTPARPPASSSPIPVAVSPPPITAAAATPAPVAKSAPAQPLPSFAAKPTSTQASLSTSSPVPGRRVSVAERAAMFESASARSSEPARSNRKGTPPKRESAPPQTAQPLSTFAPPVGPSPVSRTSPRAAQYAPSLASSDGSASVVARSATAAVSAAVPGSTPHSPAPRVERAATASVTSIPPAAVSSASPRPAFLFPARDTSLNPRPTDAAAAAATATQPPSQSRPLKERPPTQRPLPASQVAQVVSSHPMGPRAPRPQLPGPTAAQSSNPAVAQPESRTPGQSLTSTSTTRNGSLPEAKDVPSGKRRRRPTQANGGHSRAPDVVAVAEPLVVEVDDG